MGFRRFSRSATQQANLESYAAGSVFVSRAVRQEALQNRASNELEEEKDGHTCSGFVAATEKVKKSVHCDITGAHKAASQHADNLNIAASYSVCVCHSESNSFNYTCARAISQPPLAHTVCPRTSCRLQEWPHLSAVTGLLCVP
jgi:hypothetical protein